MPPNLHRFFPGWEWRTSNTAPSRQFSTLSARAMCFHPCQQFSPCSLLRLEILVNVLDGIITQHILFLSVLQGNFAALPLHRQASVYKGGICIFHPPKKRGGEKEGGAAWGMAGIGSALDPLEVKPRVEPWRLENGREMGKGSANEIFFLNFHFFSLL